MVTEEKIGIKWVVLPRSDYTKTVAPKEEDDA